jgi:hypothetical protein
MGCSVCVDSGSGGSVDTNAVVAAEGAVAVLFVSCVGELVMDGIVGSQLARNRVIINPVKYDFIERNTLSSILVL